MEIPLPPIGPISWIWAGGQTCLSNGACHSWTTASAGGYRLLPSRPNKFVRNYLHLPDPDSKGSGRGWIIDYRLFCTTVLRTVSQAHLARNSSYGRHHRSTVRTRISPRSLAPAGVPFARTNHIGKSKCTCASRLCPPLYCMQGQGSEKYEMHGPRQNRLSMRPTGQ
jgi:hypothetical protein